MLKIITSPKLAKYDISQLLWLVLAIFTFIYVALFFVSVSFSPLWRAVQPYAEIIIQHPSLIRLSTCLLCCGCAWFLCWPREGSRFIGRWSDYVALAFATYAIQYGLRFIELRFEEIASPAFNKYFHDATSLIVYICSAANNLLFLAAARILLNKNKSVQKIYELEDNTKIFFQFRKKLRNAIAEFRGAVPVRALIVAIFGPIALLDSKPGFFWARYPDAIFSVYCLAWFGWAVAINLAISRRKALAAVGMLIALTYGGAQLVYAFNPIINYSTLPNREHSRPIDWVQSKIGVRANQLARQTNTQTGRKDSTITFLDNAVYAILLPLKLALFLPAFCLYILVVSSMNDLRPALFDSIMRRKDYLSSDGIVGAIGSAIGATKICLYIRIPGTQESEIGREERALPLAWNSDGRREKAEPISINSHPYLKYIMKDKGKQILDSNPIGVASRNGDAEEHPWVIPIRFHGAVIGALQADLKKYRKNHTTLQKVRLMSDVIAPSVQDYRSLAALDQMGFRFTRLQVEHPEESFRKATQRLSEVMHDILSPLASGMIIEIGFTSIHHFHSNSEADERLLRDQENDSWLEDEETRLIGENQSIRLEKSKTLIRSRQHHLDGTEPVQIGGVMFTNSSHHDEFNSPTLAAYYLNRKAVASHVADGILDVARGSFNSIIKDLALHFSTEPSTDSDWFKSLQSAIKRSGILWVVAQSFRDGSSSEKGDRLKVHPGLSDKARAILFSQPLATPCALAISTPCVVEVLLPKSNHRLWLGVEREGFGPELDFESPWKLFLNDFADVADAALESMHRKREVELARQDQSVMTIAVTTGTLTHQFFNMMHANLMLTDAMAEEARKPEVQLSDRYINLVNTLRTAAVNGMDLIEAFQSITEVQDPRPCRIREAVDEAHKLYRASLRDRKIIVNPDPSTELEAHVPFFVAAFTVANLVGNASDAIRYNGSIDIQAEENEQFRSCHVTHTGPAIAAPAREKLFKFGETTKKQHKGWGLYFVKRLLIQSHGDIWLAHSEENSTRFTFKLPRNSTIV